MSSQTSVLKVTGEMFWRTGTPEFWGYLQVVFIILTINESFNPYLWDVLIASFLAYWMQFTGLYQIVRLLFQNWSFHDVIFSLSFLLPLDLGLPILKLKISEAILIAVWLLTERAVSYNKELYDWVVLISCSSDVLSCYLFG